MTIGFEDFEKVDIRLGRIVHVEDFPEMKKPSFKLRIDFGDPIGIKNSSVQAPGAHSKEELLGMLVACIVNFSPKRMPSGYLSDVLTLGFPNSEGEGWILITPSKKSVKLGDKLR